VTGGRISAAEPSRRLTPRRLNVDRQLFYLRPAAADFDQIVAHRARFMSTPGRQPLGLACHGAATRLAKCGTIAPGLHSACERPDVALLQTQVTLIMPPVKKGRRLTGWVTLAFALLTDIEIARKALPRILQHAQPIFVSAPKLKHLID
jgi:hypothetical protein